MKKLFLCLFLTAAIFAVWSHGETLFGKLLLLEEPRIHKVEKGEYLSKLAQQYYGDPQRWRELALVNRAPNPNHLEVGEEVLVPAANVVAELARAQTLTRVNELTRAQQQIATRAPSPQTPQVTTPTATSPEPVLEAPPQSPAQSAPVVEPLPAPLTPVEPERGFPWIGLIVCVLLVALVAVGFVLYRNSKAREYQAYNNAADEDYGFSKFRSRRKFDEYTQSQSQIKAEKDKAATKSEPLETEKPHGQRETSLVLPGKA